MIRQALKIKTEFYNKKLNYLNEGIGEPCAGQVRAMLLPFLSLKVEDSSLEENFGFEDPIGSA